MRLPHHTSPHQTNVLPHQLTPASCQHHTHIWDTILTHHKYHATTTTAAWPWGACAGRKKVLWRRSKDPELQVLLSAPLGVQGREGGRGRRVWAREGSFIYIRCIMYSTGGWPQCVSSSGIGISHSLDAVTWLELICDNFMAIWRFKTNLVFRNIFLFSSLFSSSLYSRSDILK